MKEILTVILTVLIIYCSSCKDTGQEVEQWSVFEKDFRADYEGNPYKEVELFALFTNGEKEEKVRGFYDGNQMYRIRFMPDKTGEWSYTTESNHPDLNGYNGKFNCIDPTGNNYGPVRVSKRYCFEYADGKPFRPLGTTAYAWIHQGDSLEEITIQTLAKAPFNKIRMCIFPKDYLYNRNEPEYYVFERDSLGNNNYSRFSPDYFHHLEKRLRQLLDMGIEADIILFHPYDRWGYQSMSDTTDQFYLEYLIARLAAFRNIWWSAANEFDFMQSKTMDDWHRYFEIITQEDPYDHLRSIHNGSEMYDHSLPWITHASLQSTHFDSAEVWKKRWKKPLVYDECRYEGDIPNGWGNLNGKEMTAMFWKSLITGTYAGHGECYLNPADILWWSKGGELHGSSPERIGFFKTFLEEVPEEGYDTFGENFGGRYGEQYTWYFENIAPESLSVNLPKHILYSAEIIDTWNMQITPVGENFRGDITINLPDKEGIAVRFKRKKMIFPVKKVNVVSEGNLFYNQIRVDFIHHDMKSIRYTLDGSDPGPDSEKYRGPFTITENTTLKVIALGPGEPSKINEVNFEKAELNPPLKIKDRHPGYEWKSYLGEWTNLPRFNSLKPSARGRTSELTLDMAPAEDYFGIVYNGYIEIPEDEVYSFHALSDDGSAIYIDDKLVTLNDGQHGAREESGQIGLKSGLHKVEIQFFDSWYDQVLRIFVSSPKMPRQNIDNILVK